MNNYYEKYIKYKFKYKKLLENQIGGQKELKIFDLSGEHDFVSGDVEENLKKLEKAFGKRFIIKSSKLDIEVSVDLYKIKLPSDLEIYRMKYDIPDRSTYLSPFIIDFFDITKSELNNNSYI